jgi:FAD/FMN-containing dehydrogenase
MLVTPGPTRLTADAPTLLTVGFEGFEASVQDQAARGTALLTAAGLTPGQQRTCQPAEDSLGAVWDSVYAAPFVLRLDVPPDAMTDLPRHLPAALWRSPQCLIDWGCGRATWGCEEMPDALWQAVGEASGKLQGQAVIEKAPADFAARVDLFGPPRPEWKLFRDLKNALDPRGVFAPGRLPGRA